jgi:glycerol-3-phosphate dehydrogenase (NAD(P)+)
MALDVTVLGAGSYGTALAAQLARRGHATTLWDRNPDRCEILNRTHHNPRYLKHVALPEGLRAEADLSRAVSSASLVVGAVPSHALRVVLRAAAPHLRDDAEVCCATKGIEEDTLSLMPDVVRDEVPEALHGGITVLSGPSFAAELAAGAPTTFVIAGADGPARRAADAFHGGHTRVYHSHDVVGVAVGGSVKNVMAIACGITDGLGMGQNARAGIITRGLAEITRLAVAMGADPVTMMGLAGLGDLVLTCTGDMSRNRRVGLALGKGRTLRDILTELGEVAEGVVTARSTRSLARKLGVEMPITDAVFSVVHEGRAAADVLEELFGRARKHELG